MGTCQPGDHKKEARQDAEGQRRPAFVMEEKKFLVFDPSSWYRASKTLGGFFFFLNVQKITGMSFVIHNKPLSRKLRFVLIK
jgi:hypothetical protein